MKLVLRPVNLFRVALATALTLGLLVTGAQDALAQTAMTQAKTLGDMTNSVYDSLTSIQYFLSVLSYILGLYFTISGLQMLKAHIDDPGRNPAQPTMLRLGAAALFLFSPTAANILTGTIGDGDVGSNTNVVTVSSAGTTVGSDTFKVGGGLESALGRFVIDFAGPFLENLLPVFAYLAGVIFMLIGLKRLALADGRGPQAPGGMGTFGTFLIAAGLLSFGYVMFALQGSLFGKTELYGAQKLNTTDTTTIVVHANNTMWAIFIFLRIVGYVSVLRGLFMLRDVTEGGGQASMAGVSTHFVAGAALANLGYAVNMIQCTFLEPANFAFTAVPGATCS